MNNGGNTLCNSEIEYLGQESRGREEEGEKLKQNRIVSLSGCLREKTRLGRGFA